MRARDNPCRSLQGLCAFARKSMRQPSSARTTRTKPFRRLLRLFSCFSCLSFTSALLAKASSSQAPLSLCGPKRRTRAQPGKHACNCTRQARAKEPRHARRLTQCSERTHCPRANAREYAANDQSTGWTNVAIGATHAEKAASASEKGVSPSLVRLGKPACRTTHREDRCQPFRRVHRGGCSSECAVTKFLFFARSRLLCGVGIVTRPLRRLRAVCASSLRGSVTPLRSHHASHRLRP